MLYFVTFRWGDSDTWCTNVVSVTDQTKARELIEKHYTSKDVTFKPTTLQEAEPYITRGMPYVELASNN